VDCAKKVLRPHCCAHGDQQQERQGGVELQKIRIAVPRGSRPGLAAEACIIYAGMVCCAAAIVLVLAVALASAL
jgi:hypothetical protein